MFVCVVVLLNKSKSLDHPSVFFGACSILFFQLSSITKMRSPTIWYIWRWLYSRSNILKPIWILEENLLQYWPSNRVNSKENTDHHNLLFELKALDSFQSLEPLILHNYTAVLSWIKLLFKGLRYSVNTHKYPLLDKSICGWQHSQMTEKSLYNCTNTKLVGSSHEQGVGCYLVFYRWCFIGMCPTLTPPSPPALPPPSEIKTKPDMEGWSG